MVEDEAKLCRDISREYKRENKQLQTYLEHRTLLGEGERMQRDSKRVSSRRGGARVTRAPRFRLNRVQALKLAAQPDDLEHSSGCSKFKKEEDKAVSWCMFWCILGHYIFSPYTCICALVAVYTLCLSPRKTAQVPRNTVLHISQSNHDGLP